ncbi:MAG: MBOAT family protein [Muribaculaceae bacterium]|nr:MBOAT family protein [Muribaculaceae bacterium]
MVFSDLLFIFVFLPLFILTYLGGGWLDRRRIAAADGDTLKRPMLWRNLSLTLFSLLFYSWGEPVYVMLMLLAVVINYWCGLAIDAGRSDGMRKLWLIIGVGLDLVILGSFKYLGFFAGALSQIGLEVPDPQIALPIGISFYIFQSISYLTDVYRRLSPVQKSMLDLLLYIAMFPQLIAGPIVRYGTVAEEINHRTVTHADISAGSYRFFIGLGKKVIFANILGEIATQLLGGNLAHLSTAGAWVGIIAFTLQIYFDFSGYSDMAIGLGRSVGFHFPENFNHPYTCNSITDFWRRWHMSLGSFFRDYVYIPMGGNRRHQVLNILTVWFLTGMWHGASWNFILWGLYFGLIIMIEKYTLLRWHLPRVALHIYSLFVIIVGWGLFYFDDFGRLGQFFHAFFGFGEGSGLPLEVESVIVDNLWLWLAAIALCLPLRSRLADAADSMVANSASATGAYALQISRAIISVIILVVSVALLVGATNNAFIYTRF